MARRASFVRNHEIEGTDRLLVDIGNTLSASTEALKADYIAEIMLLMGYDAVNLGSRDFALGQAFLKRLEARYGLPLVSANIAYKESGKLFVRPYVVKKFPRKTFLGIPYGWLKVGIIGLAAIAPRSRADVGEPELEILDPVEAASKAVAALERQCDLVIVLAHLRVTECEKIVEAVEGIDIVIANDRRQSNTTLGETLIVPSEFGGKYVGEIMLHLDDAREIASHDWGLAVLDKNIDEDPAVLKLVAEYTGLKKSRDAVAKREPTKGREHPPQ